jgi:hypothetical protein
MIITINFRQTVKVHSLLITAPATGLFHTWIMLSQTHFICLPIQAKRLSPCASSSIAQAAL